MTDLLSADYGIGRYGQCQYGVRYKGSPPPINFITARYDNPISANSPEVPNATAIFEVPKTTANRE